MHEKLVKNSYFFKFPLQGGSAGDYFYAFPLAMITRIDRLFPRVAGFSWYMTINFFAKLISSLILHWIKQRTSTRTCFPSDIPIIDENS